MTNNMFSILKLVVIILLNKMSAYIMQNDTETVILPAWNPINIKEISLTLKVFGKQIQLNLNRNDQIVSSAFKEPSQLNALDFCYYRHKDHISSAVINLCQEYEWEGLVFLEDNTLEIRPLRKNFSSLTLTDDDSCIEEEIDISFGKPHIIKRSVPLSDISSFDSFYKTYVNRDLQDTQAELTIELAVFLDETAYNKFMPFLNNDEEELRNMILAYVNNIQAVFHHPSLGVSIDISLVYLEIMKQQPLEFIFDFETKELFKKFCEYANDRNSPNDSDPDHWDLAVYLTGSDLFKIEYGEKDYSIAGTSYNNSLCQTQSSCVLIEFGADSRITMGFASSFTTAHEIGHSLGLPHDEPYTCNSDYIMATAQNIRGQLTWSDCSYSFANRLRYKKPCLRDRNFVTKPETSYCESYSLDHHWLYHELPGREWNAKKQCEVFYRDKDANVVTLLDICQTLQCETLNQNVSNLAGPALPGTNCAHGKECRGGECVPIIEPPDIPKYCEDDNWSEWKTGFCESICLEKSKGASARRRSCKHGSYRTSNCQGLYYDVILCDNSLLCANKSRTIASYTKERCGLYKELADLNEIRLDIEKREPGFQKSHNSEKPWIACTIFCLFYSGYYETPREKMLNYGTNPYFPDGTWCHHEDGQDYYCRQHYCLPEKYAWE